MNTTKTADCLVAATDFSAGANLAVERAARLAKQWQAPLWLLHVFNDGAWATIRSLYQHEHWAGREPVLAARDRLSGLARDLSARHGIDVRAETRTGRAASEIAAFAAECGARLLVVGEHGEDWLGDALMLGGTALKLLESAHQPVLLVRHAPAGDYANILVGTDFSEHALRAAQTARALFPEARLTLCHAPMVPFEGRMRLAGAGDEDIGRYRREEEARAEEKMRGIIERLAPPVASRILSGFPPAVLAEQARVMGADLVAVGRHGGGALSERLLGSVTQNVLHQAPCDVLLVP